MEERKVTRRVKKGSVEHVEYTKSDGLLDSLAKGLRILPHDFQRVIYGTVFAFVVLTVFLGAAAYSLGGIYAIVGFLLLGALFVFLVKSLLGTYKELFFKKE